MDNFIYLCLKIICVFEEMYFLIQCMNNIIIADYSPDCDTNY